MGHKVLLGPPLELEDVERIAVQGHELALGEGVAERVEAARSVVEAAVASERPVYGITTGIGDLANVRIPREEAETLQRDIVRSHATAVGDPLPREIVRAMLLLKARTLAFGISGVRLKVVETLIAMLNHGVHPVVPSQGSLGASGDLAPLAHLGLPLMGEGRVEYRGEVMPATDGLRAAGIEPLRLSFKEGLSLVNGTEMMLALGILTCLGAEGLARCADVTAAMTVEACLGTDRAFAPEVIDLRRHAGSKVVASNLRKLLAGSGIVASHRESDHIVQDAYSLRCIPQVHGAYRDGIRYVRQTLEAELASAVDNPAVLVDRGEVVSAGNFHGESLAIALDHLGLCIAGFATIAERRLARLVDPDLNNGLPAFLTSDPGRRSGFMLAQYTAASLVSENRGLLWPASSDSIPTSAGQEDHVSMGATSARRAAQILTNSRYVIGIEALAAAQGIALRAPLTPAALTARAVATVRSVSPELSEDRSLAPEIEELSVLVAGSDLAAGLELD